MSTGTAGKPDRDRARGRGRVAGVAIAMALSLALTAATSASASTASAVATVAPIDSAATGNYLLTVTNTGEQKITLFTFGGGDGGAVAPSTCTYNAPLAGETGCPGVEPGKSIQVCYTGESSRDVHAFFGESSPITIVPALVGMASACPVPGFSPPAKPAPTPVGGSGSEKAGSTVAGFSFGKVKYKPKKGVATLPVKVTGPGDLKLSGKGVKTSTTSAKAAGTFTFTIQASGKAASKLASTGKATVKVSVTFTPVGGAATSASKTVDLTKTAKK